MAWDRLACRDPFAWVVAYPVGDLAALLLVVAGHRGIGTVLRCRNAGRPCRMAAVVVRVQGRDLGLVLALVQLVLDLLVAPEQAFDRDE